MRTTFTPRCLAVVFATLITIGIPFSIAFAQGNQEYAPPGPCGVTGVRQRADFYLPNLLGGYVIVSDERRTAEQLAATFADPADALSRLHAWCWLEQAERVYVKDDLTVDVSVHDFKGPEGATLAQRWFGFQRAHDLGLTRDTQTGTHLEEKLVAAGRGPVNIEALNNIDIDAYSNDSEYTLYARNQTGIHVPDNHVVRVSVSGDPSVSGNSGNSREAEAYGVLAQVFGVDLFPPPSA